MKIKRSEALTFGELITAASWGSKPGQPYNATSDQRAPGGVLRAAASFDDCRKENVRPSKARGLAGRIKIGLGIALLTAMTGCVGWVGGDGNYGAAVVAPEPDFYFFGDYGWGRGWHGYSHRGFESRGAAHFGGGGHGGRR
jgi:hypothetical protein